MLVVIIHTSSWLFQEWEWVLWLISLVTKANKCLPQSKIARMKFPLKLTWVTQVDSMASPAVQLADVMIGAAIEAANTLTGQRATGLNAE